MRNSQLILAGALLSLVACAAPAHRLHGTDLPKVPETTMASNNLELVRGKAFSGDVTFTGTIFDALERARWTARGFEIDGWTEQSLTGSPSKATAIFTMPGTQPGTERVATLDVVASQVRGTAVISIKIKPAPKTGSTSEGSNGPAGSAAATASEHGNSD